MLDREKIVAVLKRRFPGAPVEQVAAATNAIVGLDDEWEELSADATASVPCRRTCYLYEHAARGASFKVFRKRSAE
jgi:hypothetical protein